LIKKPQIRFVKKTDLKNLVELCKQHANFEKADYNPTNKEQLLNINIFSNKPNLFCLVVEHENEIIGYATYMKQFSTWDSKFYIYMDCLFLTEKSRGFGLGEDLIERIKVEGKKLKCNHIQWQTPDFNKRAIKFYERIGGISKSKERYFLKV
jgi:GNAT superfamily N-acetyltransferase